MSEPIISISGLGKQYWLSHQKRADTLRDAFAGFARGMKSRLAGRSGHTHEEEFWALRDISFDVQRGEVVGIIGRNGAGKSTLLKVLSRITEPTTGKIHLRGRVASLLEVGTGFHPELTGRDNIYLNGAILGMSRAEIRQKFDEIVAFAEVDRFLDMRVKHYSSGMYVRLAFAVAAHLEPEILIVDEVLAVGDAAFQRKCLGKMEAVARGGRTVLFVSHNIAAVERLCAKAIWLRAGRLVKTGPTAEVAEEYLRESFGDSATAGELGQRFKQRAADFQVERFEVLVNGRPGTTVRAGARCTFRLHYRCDNPARLADGLGVSLMLYAPGQKMTCLWSPATEGKNLVAAAAGVFECDIPKWPFREMPVRVDVHVVHRLEHLLEWEDAVTLESLDGDYYGTGLTPDGREGYLYLPAAWSTKEGDASRPPSPEP